MTKLKLLRYLLNKHIPNGYTFKIEDGCMMYYTSIKVYTITIYYDFYFNYYIISEDLFNKKSNIDILNELKDKFNK